MKLSSNFFPIGQSCIGCLLSLVFTCHSIRSSAQEPKSLKPLPIFDVRVNAPVPQASLRGAKQADLTSKRATQSASISQALNNLKAAVPGVEATPSSFTGGIELLGAATFLTDASPGQSGANIVLEFYSNNKALFGLTHADLAGLRVIGESISPSGLRTVRIEQTVNGNPVFQSETRVSMNKDGRIVRVVGSFVPDATASVKVDANQISAQAAFATAMASVKVNVDASAMTLVNTNALGTKTEIVVNDPDVSGNVPSQLVYFLVAPGVLVPAWSQVAHTPDNGWYTIVDAGTGAVLWRKSIQAHASTEEARFRVFVQLDGVTPADNPAPLSPTNVVPGSGTQPPEIATTIVSMLAAQSIVASPNGWITDGAGNTTTNGNNVHAYMDAVGGADNNIPDSSVAFIIDGAGKPIGNPDIFFRNRDFLGVAPRNFSGGFLPPPQVGNPEAGQTATGNGSSGTLAIDSFRRGSITQAFYTTNWYHDQLHALGFNQAAGNFQVDNFGGGGLGGDAVLAETQDNSGTNNANFNTPPDGQSGRMQMFRFTGPTIDRDSNLDSEILIHELTHGLSNRLVGNAAGLNWAPGQSMGEGWSDFYAISLLNRTNADDPNARYAAGAYATYKLGGLLDNYLYAIRRFPYCTDNAVNPLTWADVDQTTASDAGGIAASPLGFSNNGAMEVHNAGEIWCMSLWEVRSRVIADPAGANGSVPTGNQTMLQITTDAMKLTPIDPSFVEARDALLVADFTTSASANEQSIWAGFADRGLGYKALLPNKYQFGYTSSHLGVKESFDLPYLDVQSVAINDAIGNNNGALDPNEPSQLVVQLKNPWRNATKSVASATAVLTSSTPGVVINNGNSTYGAIAALGNANGTPFQITIPPGATAGQLLNFTITVTSTLGVKAVDFTRRVGTAGGAGAVQTFTRIIVGGLAIPDNNKAGVIDTFNIAAELDIMDLDFRVDSLTHTWTGDVTVMLKGPSGYGAELISAIGGNSDGGSGDNMTNMVIDDQSPNGNLVNILAAAAPYTGTWQPMFNQTAWDAIFTTHDPVGQLSRFNNTSSLGNWKVVVSDQFAADAGTLNGYSILITPRTYTVSPFVGGGGAIPVASALGSAVTDEFAPNGAGANDGTKFDTLLRGGFIAENGNLVFPGELQIGVGGVNATNFQGIWKHNGALLTRLTRSGDTAPESGGALFSALPALPAINDGGQVTILASLLAGAGAPVTTTNNDTGLWSELGGTGFQILIREDDQIPGLLAGTLVGRFDDGCFATAMISAAEGEAAFTITMKGLSTDTALLRCSVVNSNTTAVGVVARENAAAPGVAGQSFGFLNSDYTDAVRMDAQGNIVFGAVLKPSGSTSLWYQPRGGALVKAIVAGDAAPGTTATFQSLDLPCMGGSGSYSFRGVLNQVGDNATNARNDGIWRGTAAGPFTNILRRGDTNALRPGLNLPSAAAKAGNIFNGWLTNNNLGAWLGWVDLAGDGISPYPADTLGIYTDLSGTMTLLIASGNPAPGIAGASMFFIDHPVVGGSEDQLAFIGTVTGGGTTGADNKGIWRSDVFGGALSLVLRTGGTITTSQGVKTIADVDLPGSNLPDHQWEQRVMDADGRLIVFVTFTDGSTSQVLVP